MNQRMIYYHLNQFILNKKVCFNLAKKIKKPSDVLHLLKNKPFALLLYYKLNGFDSIVPDIWDELRYESQIYPFIRMEYVLKNELTKEAKERIMEFLINLHYGGSCSINQAKELFSKYKITLSSSMEDTFITKTKKKANKYWSNLVV